MTKEEMYLEALEEFPHLFSYKSHWLTLLSNFTAWIKEKNHLISWIGFYLYDGDKLFLGPFQGKLACETIRFDQGVCGQAALLRKTVIVGDVSKFPGHIACDHLSLSEIVIPLVRDNRLIGVLDLDSYKLSAFDAVDQKYLEKLVALLLPLLPY